MTALDQDRNTPRKAPGATAYGVAAAAAIYAGSLVALNSTGYLVPASNTAGLRVVGRAEENVDNTAGADGDKTCLVAEGIFRWAVTGGITRADIGKPVFAADDQTLQVASTSQGICAGIAIEYVSATEVWVSTSAVSRKAAEAMADLAVAPTQADFNNLLARLRKAGVLAQ